MDVIAETPRLILRRYTRDDLPAAAELLGDPEVMRFSLGVKTPGEVEAWLDRVLLTYEKRGFGLWAVLAKPERRHIGYCGLIPQVIDGRDEVEIAYRLLPAYWGRGLGTEAARAVRSHAWGPLGLDRLISIIEPANAASIRVAEKGGLVLEKETVAWDRTVRIYVIHKASDTARRPGPG